MTDLNKIPRMVAGIESKVERLFDAVNRLWAAFDNAGADVAKLEAKVAEQQKQIDALQDVVFARLRVLEAKILPRSEG